MSLWDFARLAGSELLQEADYASVLATALHQFGSRTDLALTPGAGLIWRDKRLRIVVLADAKRSGLEPGVPVPLSQSPIIASWTADALRGTPDWMSSIDILAIYPPERQIAPGGQITGPSLGTIGTQVRWNSGSGFLTAGHVAPSVTASVYDGRRCIGTVVWSNDPAGHGTAIEPDIAVIELQPGVTLSNPIPRKTTAGPAATISVLSSGMAGVVMGVTPFLFMQSQNATCGDTYFTTSEITTGGDSGGPVMLGGDVIGHVVGASPGIMSFVQDLDYQLREAANPLRAGLPGLRI
jgi:hypothetical protein